MVTLKKMSFFCTGYVYIHIFCQFMCKTLNLKNGRHFVLLGDLKNVVFVHRDWGAAPSGTNPDGNAPFGTAPFWALHRRARTLMGTHPSAQCPWNRTVGHEPLRERTLRHSPIIYQSIHHPLTHTINPHKLFVVHCSGSMLSLV